MKRRISGGERRGVNSAPRPIGNNERELRRGITQSHHFNLPNAGVIQLMTEHAATGTPYDVDIIAWANEQAALLRAGQFAAIDSVRIAEEIEDVGKSERRELASRLAVLLAHLLKWQFQSNRRSASWQRTIKEQRRGIAAQLRATPSLKVALADANWQEGVWADAVTKAIDETGLTLFPDECPWTIAEVLTAEFYPE